MRRPVFVLVLLVLLGVLALPRAASAQIVNVQGSLAKEPAPGWSGTLTGGLDWQTGNVEIVKVAGAGSTIYRCGPWLALALVRGEYSEGEGVKLAQKTFEHLRGRRALRPRLLWEGFGQHEYDAFRRLSVRAVVGTGPAVRVIVDPRGSLTAGLAYLLEYEQLSTLADAADSGARAWRHRLSSYLTGSLELGDDVTGTQTVYVQPRLDDPGDLLVLSESSVQSKLGARLSLVNSFVLAYDASPPETIAALATSLKVSVAVTF